MLRPRNDYRCKLISNNGTELMRFNASTAGDQINNASFIGGGIAVFGQALTIWTEKAYEYTPYTHSVLLDGKKYKITSVQKGMRKKMGASCAIICPVYVLTLE